MSIRPNSKLLVGAVIGMVVAVSAAAVAQGTSPSAPAPQAPAPQALAAPVANAPAVVAPVVPTAPAQNPGALAAIEQSVTTAPAPGVPAAQAGTPAQVVAAPGSIVQAANPAAYVVPPAGPGIFQGSEQTLREIAFLQTEVALNAKRKEHVDSVMALEAAKKDLSDQLSGKTKDDKSAPSAAGGPLPEGAAVVAVPVKPEPYVNSVYGYGNDMYAEIVLGQTKVLATKGTVLTDGSRVVSVSNSGVTISSKGRSKKLAIRGAAGF